MSQRYIAQQMKCSQCVVQTTLKRFKETKDIKTMQRTSRKKWLHCLVIFQLLISLSEAENKHCKSSVQILTRQIFHQY